MAFFGFVKFGVFSREEPYYVDGHGNDKISAKKESLIKSTTNVIEL